MLSEKQIAIDWPWIHSHRKLWQVFEQKGQKNSGKTLGVVEMWSSISLQEGLCDIIARINEGQSQRWLLRRSFPTRLLSWPLIWMCSSLGSHTQICWKDMVSRKHGAFLSILSGSTLKTHQKKSTPWFKSTSFFTPTHQNHLFLRAILWSQTQDQHSQTHVCLKREYLIHY